MKTKKTQDIFEISYLTRSGKPKRTTAPRDQVSSKCSRLRDRGAYLILVSSEPLYTQEAL